MVDKKGNKVFIVERPYTRAVAKYFRDSALGAPTIRIRPFHLSLMGQKLWGRQIKSDNIGQEYQAEGCYISVCDKIKTCILNFLAQF